MFPDAGPLAAIAAFKTYIVTPGLAAFPEAAREPFAKLIGQDNFTVLTEGTERLFAALIELTGMPDAPGAWAVLGGMAQHVGLINLAGKSERGWALMAHANVQVNGVDPGGTPPPVPEVDPTFSFIPAPAPDPMSV